MKKISTLLLALVATTALCAADFEVDGIAYNILGGDSVEVTSKTPDYLDSITIPSSVTYESTTYRVTSIGEWAFSDCTSLTSITIPNSVTSIGEWAFSHCTSLTTITIPKSVATIGECAFTRITSMKALLVDAANIHFSSVDGVLFNYAKDTLIQYPIGNPRTTYSIPNSVTRIGDYAFYNCSILTSVTIPNSVTVMGFSTFRDCTSLTSISIPDSVIGIGWYVFFNCSSLTSVTIPNSVTRIGESAFSYCTSLSSITCYATTPPTCDSDCFRDVTKSIPLYVPANSIDAYKAAAEWKDFTNIQAIAAEEVFEPITTVITTPTDNSITITWPTTTGADSYTIEIKKDGVVFCTLTFNAQGQLMNIAFAPGRGSSNGAVMAEEVAGGYKFTITSLTPSTKYTYEVNTKNASGTSIANYTGTFTTTGSTGLDQLIDSGFEIQNSKFIRNGQLLILRDGKMYNAQGAEL